MSPSISEGGDAFKLFAQDEANARLDTGRAEAGRAGQTPPSISASKGNGHPHRVQDEEAALLPNSGGQRK